jgi:hypothetical protein
VYAAKEAAPTLTNGEKTKMNAQEQENYLRQRVPDGLVEEYVAREQINVQDCFVPAVKLFILPGPYLLRKLCPTIKSGHRWCYMKGGSYHSAIAPGWLWTIKYGKLFTIEQTDFNLRPYHHVLCLANEEVIAPVLSSVFSSDARQIARNCDPLPPKEAQDFGVKWLPVADIPSRRNLRGDQRVLAA